ncbi:hypothetical protein JCM24511_09082 [Saitozyma sp. JCM 24511]|nr:hypothetical protein JCM24511_09082 [Saitozyma sp. JCM 24511]
MGDFPGQCTGVSDWSLVVKTFVGPKGSDKRRTKSKAAWVVWSSCRSQVGARVGKRDVIQDKVITLPLAIIVKAVNTPWTAVSVLEAGSNQPSDHMTQWLQVLWWPEHQ